MSYQELFKQLAATTQARINLGNSGSGLPTKPLLAFRYDHALAKDAVYTNLDIPKLQEDLLRIGLDSIAVHSQATERDIFLKRPDLGRKLEETSRHILLNNQIENELTIIISDGLSAQAVQAHAVPFINSLIHLVQNIKLTKVIIAKHGRVAISDEIGELCKATISIILIGERPGLSSPDSMGIYLTYQPKSGNTDEKRNCISNIRQQGLSYDEAALKLNFLIRESLRLKLSGVYLKEKSPLNKLI